MGKPPITRTLVLVLCVALLALVLSPVGVDVWALLVPCLVLFAALFATPVPLGRTRCAPCQPVSFLSLDSSRAPPSL